MTREEEEDDLAGLIQALKIDGPSTDKEDEDLVGLIQGLQLTPKLDAPRLRPYQQKLVEQVHEKFTVEKCSSVLMYLPTGGGKSAICATIATQQVKEKNRVAVFVHRDELAVQMESALLHWTGEKKIGFIKANKPVSEQCRIQIISIQTFSKRYLKSTEENEVLPKFDLIIIDEAHHAMASEYLEVKQRYAKSNTRFLGLTATPFRLTKGEMLGDLFQCTVFGPTMRELQTQGYLVPYVTIRSSSSIGQVGRKASQHVDVLTAAVVNWKKRYSSLKTLAFCVNLAHAAKLCDLFEQHGVTAAVLSGKDKAQKRESLFTQSRLKEISVLCTVDVVSEGVDTVWINCLLMLRPTESLGLYIQQLGRGLRPFAGKTQCTVLDEVGNIWDHGFADELDMEMEMKQEVKGTGDKLHRLTIYPCQGYRCRALASKRANKTCSKCRRNEQQQEEEEENAKGLLHKKI